MPHYREKQNLKSKNYGRQGKPTAVSKKFSGNTLKDAEGKDIVF